MKIKINLLIISAALLLFSGCDDLFTVSLDATFEAPIQIIVPAQTKSTGFPFSKSYALNIEDNADVKKHMKNLKGIDIKSIDCVFIDMPQGLKIHEITVKVAEANFEETIYNIEQNSTVTFSATNEKLLSLSQYLYQNKAIDILVFGVTSNAPVTFNLKLKFHSEIKAGA
jgi:hypothetical protein